METLYLLGASRRARDVIDLVMDLNAVQARWHLAGILDDDISKQGAEYGGVPVLGPVESARRLEGSFLLCVVAPRARRVRRRIIDELGVPRERFATLIHPSASVSPRATVGKGVAILQNVVIGPEVRLGDHLLIEAQSTIGHDSEVGDYTYLGPGIGVSGRCRIGESVYLGSGCRLRQDVIVGDRSVVAMGAIVLRDVAAEIAVSGNPARQV